MKLLPVALKVEGTKALVAGGGPVAARKVRSLLECGAQVHVVAPAICDELLPLLSARQYSLRHYRSSDSDSCALIFACTDNVATNAQIAADAQERNIWCQVADDAGRSTLHGAATVRRDDICIGITTGGGSPALAKHLKSQIEDCIGREYSQLLQLMSERRDILSQSVATQSARAGVWRSILESEVLSLLRDGQTENAENLIDDLLSPTAKS